MSDADMLDTLAEWFDLKDLESGSDGDEVQVSLRRIAQRLREIDTPRRSLINDRR